MTGVTCRNCGCPVERIHVSGPDHRFIMEYCSDGDHIQWSVDGRPASIAEVVDAASGWSYDPGDSTAPARRVTVAG